MENPRHVEAYSEVAGHGYRGTASRSRLDENRDHEEMHRLLREATALIEKADLGLASEKLREAGDLASGDLENTGKFT
jgi:hypothetical protein